jgi:plastocyanin
VKSASPAIAVVASVILTLAGAACTPGASTPSVAGALPAGATVTTIDVNLTLDPGGATAAGPAGGYRALATVVALGTYVQFQNSDGFAHTATSIAATTYPASYPFTNAALTPSGSTLSGGFSSGNLAAGTISSPILADVAGRYIFGCFYHYGTPMRAEIDVH